MQLCEGKEISVFIIFHVAIAKKIHFLANMENLQVQVIRHFFFTDLTIRHD